MQTLQELINIDDPAWPLLKDWIEKARNPVEILPSDRHKADQALVLTQVTTRSMMGAIVHQTGGLLIDGGWIRILGSGCDRLKRSLPDWNKGKTFQEYGEQPPYLLVADDAVGGFFAINGGMFGEDLGSMYYFSPDIPDWLPMKISYTDFLLFCFDNNLDEFYEGLRWNGWEKEIEHLKGDYSYTFFPFLWTEEGSDINKIEHRAVPIEEVYSFNMEMKSTLN